MPQKIEIHGEEYIISANRENDDTQTLSLEITRGGVKRKEFRILTIDLPEEKDNEHLAATA